MLNQESLVGIAALGLPLLILLALFLRRHRPIRWFAFAMLAVGLGYLTATGACRDIGAKIIGLAGGAVPAVVPAPKPVAR
jgi:hypothetical protein